MGDEDVTPTGKIQLPLPAPPVAPVDPTKILGQLKDIVANNKAPTGGGKSWVSTLIIIAVALAGIAIWAWVSWRQGKELARLRHQKEVDRIRLANKVIEDAIASDKIQIDNLDARYADAEKSLAAIEARIETVEAKHRADKAAIASIRSWRDAVPDNVR